MDTDIRWSWIDHKILDNDEELAALVSRSQQIESKLGFMPSGKIKDELLIEDSAIMRKISLKIEGE